MANFWTCTYGRKYSNEVRRYAAQPVETTDCDRQSFLFFVIVRKLFKACCGRSTIMVIHGQCHCGNVSFELTTDLLESEISPRACDCSFCRMHGAGNWSDPNGHATINITDQSLLQKYLFALKTAEFYICKTCGTYIGAVLSDQDGMWSTLNLRITPLHGLPTSPASYGAEQADERILRRKNTWTPTTVVTASLTSSRN